MQWKNKETGRTLPGWYTRLAHWIDLEVAELSDGSYSVRVGGTHVAGGIKSLERAQARAIEAAREMLVNAINELEKDQSRKVEEAEAAKG